MLSSIAEDIEDEERKYSVAEEGLHNIVTRVETVTDLVSPNTHYAPTFDYRDEGSIKTPSITEVDNH